MHDDIEQPGDGLLERVRALADGRLSSEEQERLLTDASASAEDAELMSAFREVHALTAVAGEEPPPCRVTFEDVERRIAADEARGKRLFALPSWRIAAAALLVVGVGLAASHWRGLGGHAGSDMDGSGMEDRVADAAPTAVRVASIPEHPAPAADGVLLADVDAAAAPLSDFVPMRDGQPQWLASLDEGRAVAKVTGRPVLLFIHHPTCPMCLDMKSKTFTDSDVQARLQQFVPVMVDVMQLPEELGPFLERGWPYLGALDADGGEFAAFPGLSKASTFRRHLDDALAEFGGETTQAWGLTRALAARWADAAGAAEKRDMQREWRELDALRADDSDGPFGRAAAARLAQRLAELRGVLADADAAAETDVADGLRVLDTAIECWKGTPFEHDLQAVRDALDAERNFPRLQFTSTKEEVR